MRIIIKVHKKNHKRLHAALDELLRLGISANRKPIREGVKHNRKEIKLMQIDSANIKKVNSKEKDGVITTTITIEFLDNGGERGVKIITMQGSSVLVGIS